MEDQPADESSEIPLHGSLQVGQDLAFQRRQYVEQRIGWVLMGLIIVLALLGFTGSGPLTTKQTTSSDGTLRVTYARYVRHLSPHSIDVEVKGHAVQDKVVVRFDRAFLDGVSFESVHPEPESTDVSASSVSFTFSVSEPGQDVRISFDATYDDFGRKRGTVQLEGGPPVPLSQFVYP